ncbi:hypothetical protein [Zooshikella sp. RANM57]|uniref:hypothetical protein n=1 Tax=Zooshikella sp. RANM57 TaxID=3425863 RepID=UPI003D6F6CF7
MAHRAFAESPTIAPDVAPMAATRPEVSPGVLIPNDVSPCAALASVFTVASHPSASLVIKSQGVRSGLAACCCFNKFAACCIFVILVERPGGYCGSTSKGVSIFLL